MAHSLAPKAPTEVVERRWAIPVRDDDHALSAALSTSGITVPGYAVEDDELILSLTGGTAQTVGIVTATITTAKGDTLVETLYIPVFDSTALQAKTVRDICDFALRKVIGNGETADGAELTDAIERLEAMLHLWRDSGADVGATFPLDESATLYLRDSFVSGVQYGLRMLTQQHYGIPLEPLDVQMATRGLQAIKHANLGQRSEVEHY